MVNFGTHLPVQPKIDPGPEQIQFHWRRNDQVRVAHIPATLPVSDVHGNRLPMVTNSCRDSVALPTGQIAANRHIAVKYQHLERGGGALFRPAALRASNTALHRPLGPLRLRSQLRERTAQRLKQRPKVLTDVAVFWVVAWFKHFSSIAAYCFVQIPHPNVKKTSSSGSTVTMAPAEYPAVSTTWSSTPS